MPRWTTRRRPAGFNAQRCEADGDVVRVEDMLLSMDEGWMGGMAIPEGIHEHEQERDYAAEQADPMLLERMDVVFWGGPISCFDSGRQVRATGDAISCGNKTLKNQFRREDSAFVRTQNSIPAHRCRKFSMFEAVMDELWYGDDGVEAPPTDAASRESSAREYGYDNGDVEKVGLLGADARMGRIIGMFDERWHGAVSATQGLELWFTPESTPSREMALRRQWSTRVGVIGRLDMWWGGAVESVESQKAPEESYRVSEARARHPRRTALDLVAAMDEQWSRV
ncbi:hypothetical protein BSKO_09631 [Bryopsis sp. KO-2023]|nr:hypothetical protein BSKO_09631 [Bryopsis sp. KO-2023]